MTKEAFESYAAGRGWKVVGSTAVTVWREKFPISITRVKNGTPVGYLYYEASKQAGNAVRQLKKEWKHTCSFTMNNQLVVVNAKSRGDDAIEQIAQGMDALTAALQEAGCTPPKRCPICKREGCDSAALVRGYVPVHAVCVHSHQQNTAQKAEENMLTGNYFTGFLGALAGGFVGAVPSLLSILFMERIFVILYALIPLAAFYGYKLLKGKMNRFAFVSSLICGVISVFALNFAVFAIAATQEYGALPMLLLIYAFFSDLGTTLASMIMDFIFLALGLFICYGRISQTAQTEAAGAANMEASLIPLEQRELV